MANGELTPAGEVPGDGGEAVLGLGVCDLCVAELGSCALHPARGRLQTHQTTDEITDRKQLPEPGPEPEPLQQPGLHTR